MQKEQGLFHPAGGKRLILVVDDEAINREMLGMYLQDEYEILQAENGSEAMKILREYSDSLSLVLLDILMPVMTGMEVLKQVGEDMELSRIPFIVLTADQEAEVECLGLGAMDFIPKPYPAADVVLARIRRTIELSEDRDLIQSTERDGLTGLYAKEFFFRYAGQYDQRHRDQAMDAVLLDVNHFHMLNERYGKAYGDQVLLQISDGIREALREKGGIACRREADTFLIYWPHREDYRELLESTLAGPEDEMETRRIRLRCGIYENVDRSIDIERRFDRAKTAADTVKGNFTKTIAWYDNALHERELYAEQLIEDFYRALKEKQFTVYFQPKFNVKRQEPILCSAEALVRWEHPALGLISPGVFIPLFEANGLIRELDNYVWRETCRQVREWENRLHTHVPVSVNMSRIDLYDPELQNTLQGLLREYRLTSEDILLEVTESAYTQDGDQIVAAVKQLSSLGFQIEMDDFGTGYSSLNMVSSLPFDVLKLDMQFIRSAFRDGGDTKMLELIIDIADYLRVPVIAEGVETKEQMIALKTMGCDMVQGYYFSKPLPAKDFENFLLRRVKQMEEEKRQEAEPKDDRITAADLLPKEETAGPKAGERAETAENAENAGAAGINVQHEEASPEGGVRLKAAIAFTLILSVLSAAALLFTDRSVSRGFQRMEAASDRHIACQMAAWDMESGSDYLTDRVRCFVMTGDTAYLDDFFREVQETRRRDQAIEKLETLLGDDQHEALQSLNGALSLSNELLQTEYQSMRLKLESMGVSESLMPEAVAACQLAPGDQALTDGEKDEKARTILFDSHYMDYKDRIRQQVGQCTDALLRTSSQNLDEAAGRMSRLVRLQSIVTLVLLAVALAVAALITRLVRQPLSSMVRRMQAREKIPAEGVHELRQVAQAYNTILDENKAAHERLKHEASHDALTGLLNRGAYDLLIQSVDITHIALILVDVDYFKSVNDTYGHAVGDMVLKRVAEVLKKSFRSVDIICRIGGDEFVVIMTRVNSSMKQLVMNKIAQANEQLKHPKDEVPPVSLSVGIAFADRENPEGDIFKDADTALYRVKEAGRDGCGVF